MNTPGKRTLPWLTEFTILKNASLVQLFLLLFTLASTLFWLETTSSESLLKQLFFQSGENGFSQTSSYVEFFWDHSPGSKLNNKLERESLCTNIFTLYIILKPQRRWPSTRRLEIDSPSLRMSPNEHTRCVSYDHILNS